MFLLLLTAAAGTGAQAARPAPLLDRNRIDAPVRAPVAPTPVRPAPDAVDVDAGGSDTSIRRIRFTGVDAPRPVAAAAREFIGRPATVANLKALAASLSAAYAEADAALYTVGIPEQDFADGEVEIRLREGSISAAALKAPVGAHPQLRGRIAPLLDEKPLSRRRLERQTALMQAIPGMRIETALTDPDGDGAATLTVTPYQRRTKLTAGFSNRGVDLLGDGQFDVRGDLYGGVVDGDQLSVTAAAAGDFRRFRYVSGAYQAPVGVSGLTGGVNLAYLKTRPRGVPVTGEATQAAAFVSFPWRRSARGSGDVSLSLDGTNSANAVVGNVVASERTRVARAAASWSITLPRRSASTTLAVAQGLDVAGARVTRPDAETEFRKASAAVAVAQAIGGRTALRISATGQYSADRLPAAERFTVGGEAFGRAFDIAILTGDRGAAALAELAWRPRAAGAFSTSEVYAFSDAAIVGIRPRGAFAGGDFALASAGIGTRFRFRDEGELSLEAAAPIDDPFAGYDEDWRVSVGWRVSI